jgi:replicative DNA helicase
MEVNIHSSGFKSLDSLIGGFADGELVLIGGGPIAGVTQILINLAIAFSKDSTVFYFAPIHLQSSVINRINDTVTITELESSYPLHRIYTNDSCSNPMGALRALRQTFIEEHKLECIIIDDLQELCHSSVRRKFFKELKSIAMDFGVTVIVATEINKAIDTRKNKKPRLNDLPKNKLLAELPDKIIFVHRPERSRTQVELIVAKNSNGAIGSVQLMSDESLTNIVDQVSAI